MDLQLEQSDFVVNVQNGFAQSGGFLIENVFLKQQKSAININNSNKSISLEKVSDIFKDLAVPSGLLYIQSPQKPINYMETTNIVDNTLYDKLVNLMEVSKVKKKLSKRNNSKSFKNKTKKNI